MDDVLRVKVEHNYQTPLGANPKVNLTNLRVNMSIDATKQDLYSNEDPEDALMEFIHVIDLTSVVKCVEEKIATWRHKDLVGDSLNKGSGPLGKEVLAYQRKYDKRMQALQNLIVDVVNLSKKEQQNNEQSVQILRKELDASRVELRTLQRRLESIRANRDKSVDSRESIMKKIVAARDKIGSDLEAKCESLTKELNSLKRDKLDLGVIKTWLDVTLISRQIFKEKLTEMKTYVQNMRRKPTLNIETTKKGNPRILPATPSAEKKTRRFYLLEREQWLVLHDRLSMEIDREFDALRENLSLLKCDLEKKTEQRGFPEGASQIFEEELRLKDESVDVGYIKEEDCLEEDFLLGFDIKC